MLFENAELKELLKSKIFQKQLAPCVIDLAKVRENAKLIKNMDYRLLQSRVKVHGTDGIRGVVSLEGQSPGRNFLQIFSCENKLTPDFVRNAAYAFSQVLIDTGVLKIGDGVLIGEDGRDYMKGKPFKSALSAGINLAGLDVHDAGVMMTPGVPIFMTATGLKAAVALTASHNPSNQNGMKFFVNGFKVLPEGMFGDYSITAYMYRQLLEEKNYEVRGKNHYVAEKAGTALKNATILNIPFASSLKGTNLVFDPANGAGTVFGKQICWTLKIKAACINDVPNGKNINQGGGVAMLEGLEKFDVLREELTSLPLSVREMLQKKCSYGLVLDGDGDRCYLLVHNQPEGMVYVLNGDKLSYILARCLRKQGVKNQVFVNTVESDLMAGYSVSRDLKIKTRLACVGDKWVVKAVGKKDKLVIGAEESGHVIIPIKVNGKTVFCGNGLLTGLTALACIRKYEISVKDICSPYKEGYKKTFYTYLVNKKLFQRGSPVFNADKAIAIKEFSQLKKEQGFKGSIEECIFKDDIDMLYLSVLSEKKSVGAIFIRNSGTETKTSINIRCLETIQELLVKIAQKIAVYHSKVLKDTSNPDVAHETKVLKILVKGRPQITDLQRKIPLPDVHLKALLYGMSKEYFEHKEKLVKILSQ